MCQSPKSLSRAFFQAVVFISEETPEELSGRYEYVISWGGLINGTSLLFRGFEFWNINVEERVGYSFNFEKWAAVNVPVAVLFSLLLLAHSSSVALLLHLPNTAGTPYLARIQIYNSLSL
jgi:hypothetical protein